MTALPVWETVAATGHRPQHLSKPQRAWIVAELPRIVAKLRDEHGMTVGVSGMALGVDLWWAAALVDADVSLWAHVPFPQQPGVWPSAADRAEWRRLCDLAVEVTVYGDRYDIRHLHARNDGMLRVANAVVAVHKRSKSDGGTASAVRKARDLGRPIVLLDPEHKTVTLSNLPVPAGADHSPDA